MLSRFSVGLALIRTSRGFQIQLEATFHLKWKTRACGICYVQPAESQQSPLVHKDFCLPPMTVKGLRWASSGLRGVIVSSSWKGQHSTCVHANSHHQSSRGHTTTLGGNPNSHSPSTLPPSFTSLYRLFLRSTAVSVLSHSQATTTLRKLWRPAFAQAAVMMRLLESDGLSPARREALRHWLARWEARGQSIFVCCIHPARRSR